MFDKRKLSTIWFSGTLIIVVKNRFSLVAIYQLVKITALKVLFFLNKAKNLLPF